MKVVRFLTAVVLVAVLAGWRLHVDVTSSGSMEYFGEASRTTMAPQCEAPTEQSWRVQSIEETGLTYTRVSPRGLICVRSLDGTLAKVFRAELSSVAGFRWVDGSRFGLFEAPRLERRSPDGSWIKVAG